MFQLAEFLTTSVPNRLARPGILFVLLLLVTVRAFAGSVSLSWDPVSNPTLAGYKVYYGPAVGNYTSSVDVGNVTTYTVVNLVEGQNYHFAVTDYDATHTESAFSNDVSATVAYSAPVAQFTASTTTGTAPLALNFTSTSIGSITTYAWTFGDGGTSTVQNPAHVYNTAGVYSVSLTVTGPGGSNTKTLSNYVTVSAPPSPPVAAFSGSPTSGTTPLTVNFTDASTGTVSTWAWTFGDGTISSTQNPSHVYNAAGTYTVALTVTGPGGSNTMTRTNYVAVSAATAPPVAAISASTTSGTAPLTINFTSVSTGAISTYAWTFGDGFSSAVQNPSHVYATAGTYTAALTVTGPGGSSSSSKTILVSAGVTTSTTMLASSLNPSNVGASVVFTATITGTNPSGSVNFTDGIGSIGSCSVVSLSGSGSCEDGDVQQPRAWHPVRTASSLPTAAMPTTGFRQRAAVAGRQRRTRRQHQRRTGQQWRRRQRFVLLRRLRTQRRHQQRAYRL